ncbi:32e67b45-2d40-406b-8684-fc667e2203cf [Sclerotinia trifoliorum]|uniref:32e67b45-2d40-406b-8684-fc667e2203cf n=1 Tax=Sclerotinia trifoliorum TaxID=28548 RepID=A0A8H2VS67_9HELO|nr:32e67b45-2d40-406b-8684-fc667e2203cf [Sclerotinia trifoliorum]
MAADCLSQILEDMRLEDGRPDYQLRRLAIQHLLSSPTLTFGEKRIFNDHFKGIDFVHDIIAELPVELLALLVEYVDPEDFMSMRSVNRVWRAKLSNEKVSMSILRVHFRRTWEDLKLLGEKDKKLRLDSFPRFCTRRLKRYHRKYHQVSILPRPHVFSNISHQHRLRGNKGLFQYCNGRVAMMMDYADTTAIQVDSLWTFAETYYMHEQRCSPDHWLLSNQTLVAYFDHPKPHLNIWSLNEKSDPDVIRLECRYSILAAHNRQVAFLAVKRFSVASGIIHIWNDGRIQKLAEPKFVDICAPCEARISGFVFHPTEENHQFVFYQLFSSNLGSLDSDRTGKVIVQEYIAGVPHKTWRRNVPGSLITQALRVESIDDDGLVAILPIPHAEGDGSILHIERNENTLDFPQPLPCCKHGISSATASGLPNYSFVAFNVFTQKFQEISNHLKAIPVDPCCDKPLLWRGQSIVLCGKGGFESILSTPDDKPLKALISASVCDEKRKSKCVGDHGLRDNVKAAATFCFLIETPLQTQSATIWGDDNFIVCGFDRGYIVWSF